MVAHEGLLIAQGRGQIAHVPRAQLRQGALGLMGHKAAHGGDMVIGDAHEACELEPACAIGSAHGQGALLKNGRVSRSVGLLPKRGRSGIFRPNAENSEAHRLI